VLTGMSPDLSMALTVFKSFTLSRPTALATPGPGGFQTGERSFPDQIALKLRKRPKDVK
jgi:hypothetical protein